MARIPRYSKNVILKLAEEHGRAASAKRLASAPAIASEDVLSGTVRFLRKKLRATKKQLDQALNDLGAALRKTEGRPALPLQETMGVAGAAPLKWWFDPNTPGQISEAGLSRLAAWWQKQLRLQDWKLRISLVDSGETKGHARSSMAPQCKEVEIRLCKPSQIQGSWLGSPDLEITLVHELLHLHFDPLWEAQTKAKKSEQDALEAGIELTACALVNLRRGASITDVLL